MSLRSSGPYREDVDAWITALRSVQGVTFLAMGAGALVAARDARRRSMWPFGVALLLLGTMTVASPLDELELGPLTALDALFAMLVASGLALLEFRHRVAPLARAVRVIALAVGAVLLGGFAAAEVPHDALDAGGLVSATITGILVWWGAIAADSAVALWRSGAGEGEVIRRRLRLLAVADTTFVAIVLVALAVHDQPPGVQLAVRLAVVAVLPVIAMALAPPKWLRQRWRRGEAALAYASIQDLMARSADSEAVRDAAVTWARRLLGGSAAVLVDGADVRADGLDVTEARDLLESRPCSSGAVTMVLDEPVPALLACAPLHGCEPNAQLVVVSSPLGPVLGADELDALQRLASATAAALGHARMVARLEEQSEQMCQLLDLKDALIGSVSHDLRNPLTAVSGLVDLLVRREDQLGEDQRRDILLRVAGSAKSMERVFHDLADVRRTETSPLDAHVHDLLDVVRSADRGPHAARVVVGGEPAIAHFDAALVRRAVESLVANAVEHTDGPVQVDVAQGSGEVVVTVEDRGEGVPDEAKAEIFKPGVRLTGGLDRGRGLGLFLVHRIAELHRGAVWVEDRPGGGSRFVLALPLTSMGIPSPDDADDVEAVEASTVGSGA